MISQILKEYSQIRVSYEAVGKDPSMEITKILNKLATELARNKWKCPPMDVSIDSIAMCAFFEMFVRKIGGDAPILLCYYYSSRVASNQSLSMNARFEGNKYRAFIVFNNLDKLNMTFNVACNSPVANYRGRLDNTQFIDLLLLSDVYKAWNIDDNSTMLQKLKRKAPLVATHHPMFSKQQIIEEGELAHEAVLNIVRLSIE